MKKNLLIIILSVTILILGGVIFKMNNNSTLPHTSEISMEFCENGWKKWENKTYGFSLCMPENWTGISAFSGTATDLLDEIENIGYFSQDDFFNPQSSIMIENFNMIRKISDYGEGITDVYLKDINGNSYTVELFERKYKNNLIYRNTIKYFKFGDNFIHFFYNKDEKDSQKVIDSIRELK